MHFDYILLSELQPLQRNTDAVAAVVAATIDDDDDDDCVVVDDNVDKVDDVEKTMVNEGMFWLMLDEFGALIMIDGTMCVWSMDDGGQISV